MVRNNESHYNGLIDLWDTCTHHYFLIIHILLAIAPLCLEPIETAHCKAYYVHGLAKKHLPEYNGASNIKNQPMKVDNLSTKE